MRRTYTRERYLALVERAARRDPGPRARHRHHRRLPGRDRGRLPRDARGRRGGAATTAPSRSSTRRAPAPRRPRCRTRCRTSVKLERIERLVEVVQRIARERNAGARRARRGGARRGPEPHRRRAPARPDAPQHDGQLRRRRRARRARPGRDRGATSTTLRGTQRSARRGLNRPRCSSSGSSGRRLREDRGRRGASPSGSRPRSSRPTRCGLPRPADPDATPAQPARLVGDLAARRTRRRSASTSRSRTPRSTRRSRPDARRSSSAAPASTCAPRSRSSSCLRAAGARRARAVGAALRRASAPRAAHALLAERDRAAAARVHANDRRRVVRALELAEAGASLAPPPSTPLGRRDASSDADRRPGRAPDELDRHGSRLEPDAMFDARSRGGGARALGAAVCDGAEDARPRARSRRCRADEAIEALIAAHAALAAYQRKWIRASRVWLARGRSAAGGARR